MFGIDRCSIYTGFGFRVQLRIICHCTIIFQLSVLLMEKSGVLWENHRVPPPAFHMSRHNLSHNVLSSIPHHRWNLNSKSLVVRGIDLIITCRSQSNYQGRHNLVWVIGAYQQYFNFIMTIRLFFFYGTLDVR